jgi:hypothetical protein
MARKNFQEASLRPPVEDHQLPSEAGAPSSWAILDVRAYIADCRNATTAYGRLRNGAEIQVTFCVARPPVVSYFCFWCPEATRLADLGVEPIIKAAEADLVIFGVGLGSGFLCMDPFNIDIFIYHPGGGEKGPSLRLIMLDEPYCLSFNTGILRHHDITNPYDDKYHIVSVVHSTKKSWQFVLHLFDSRTESWSSQCLSVHGKEYQHRQFHFFPSKAIMLGQGGLMGFVDLWRGILICDVLDCSNKSLRYLPLPRALRDNKKLRLQPVLARDIVVVQGCIKIIDCFYCSASSAWKVSVWSMADTSGCV